MDNLFLPLEAYKIWAPDSSIWCAWAKPVLFAQTPPFKLELNLEGINIDWARDLRNTAIIADLPSKDGVELGLKLVDVGFRPVPLYNGVMGAPNQGTNCVNVADIHSALFVGANRLQSSRLSDDAPPVFLLDSNRLNGEPKPSMFDNRWCIFPQDMPSASFLLKNGISRVVVYSNEIRNDLAHILKRYCENRMDIFLCSNGQLEKQSVVTPSKFKAIYYRASVLLGLKRSASGGFGAKIPDPIDTTSSSSFHGIG